MKKKSKKMKYKKITITVSPKVFDFLKKQPNISGFIDMAVNVAINIGNI